jgi:hypothetical protein
MKISCIKPTGLFYPSLVVSTVSFMVLKNLLIKLFLKKFEKRGLNEFLHMPQLELGIKE